MSDDEDAMAFGPGVSELVAEVENQMAEGAPLKLEGGDSGLDLPEILLESSHCCQFATRVSSSNAVGLGDILDLVLSQEFGRFVFAVYLSCKCGVLCTI